jgi:hypothetical protein|tara:strand:+ start:75 stop:479 length:405 start_codon:yes stop_codon:yes gene_type:complete
MKKLLLISLTLFIIQNISYASFPVIEKTQTEIIETPRKIPLTDNAKILLLSLVPIPAAIIGVILFSTFDILGVFEGVLLGAIAVGSAIYSLYLNFSTNIVFWDWRNYFSIFSALVLGFLALGWTMIIIAFGGLG